MPCFSRIILTNVFPSISSGKRIEVSVFAGDVANRGSPIAFIALRVANAKRL